MSHAASLTDRWPPRDLLGRKQPHRFTVASFMLQPGPIAYVIVEAFDQVVPDEFVAEDVDEYSDEIRVIACPCGDEPAVYPLRTVECSCGRFYLNLVKEVKVYRPEGVEAALPVREPTSGS